MLKLILETGYVDPEILQELDDEQKEVTMLLATSGSIPTCTL